MDRVLGQASFAVAPADLVRQRSTKSAVGVHDVAFDASRQALLEGKLGLGDELVVKTDVETVILLAYVEGRNTGAKGMCRSQDQGQIDVLGLGRAEVVADAKDLAVTNHIVDGPEAELGHDGTELVRDIVKEVDDVLWCTSELLPELGVLSGNTDRASVQAVSG